AAFRAASHEVRAAMLSNLGSASGSAESVAPVVTFNDDSHVSQMLNTTGAIDQRYMQINVGGRKKKKS
ncbi:XRE family transcriptional regulator, partial [Xanthomonas campestris pv. lawsoniae]|nr:XRE family transcriptional regulator [Xanthomonas campestris pv. lawsoniae]